MKNMIEYRNIFNDKLPLAIKVMSNYFLSGLWKVLDY